MSTIHIPGTPPTSSGDALPYLEEGCGRKRQIKISRCCTNGSKSRAWNWKALNAITPTCRTADYPARGSWVDLRMPEQHRRSGGVECGGGVLNRKRCSGACLVGGDFFPLRGSCTKTDYHAGVRTRTSSGPCSSAAIVLDTDDESITVGDRLLLINGQAWL